MFNVGGGELLVILLVGLIVLGPSKLPDVARQVGSVARELRRMSTSFQAEMKAALDEPTEAAARERGSKVVSNEIPPAPGQGNSSPRTSVNDDDTESEISSAEAAGMYDVAAPLEDEAPAAPVDDHEAPAPDDTTDHPT